MPIQGMPPQRACRDAATLTRAASCLVVLLAAAGCSTLATTGPITSQQPAPIEASVAPSDAPDTLQADAAATAAGKAEAAARTRQPAPDSTVAPLAGLPEPTGRPPQDTPHGDLWDRIRAGFTLPDLDTPLVAEKERFYLERPDYLQRMFARGGRYLHYIVEEIERRGLPTELALLPFVESAMNPTALSSASAAGLWQFIPSTGRAYNLKQDWWVDNRRDVVKSTHAALDYLQKIYALQGNDWFLALASYNWGENAVARAVRRNEARGRPTDYLSLSMPAETRHYVPKLLALKNIVSRAQALGVALPELPNRPYFVTIEKTRPIDLKLAAQFAGMTVPEFVALNPAHNRPVIAASRNNEIKLPADRLDAFMEAVERHGVANRAFATWQPHTLQAGETLEALARRGGIAVAELRDANDLRPGQHLLPGTRLLAPQRGVEDETRVERFEGPRVYELIERPAAWHRVKRRETLASIARRYGTSVANLRALNRVGKSVKAGTLLKVRPASSQTLLTTEDGDRRIVRRDDDEPRIVRAVLRQEVTTPAAASERPAPASRAHAPARERARNAQPAPRASSKRSAAAARAPDAAKPSAAERAARSAKRSTRSASAVRTGDGVVRAKRIDKRT